MAKQPKKAEPPQPSHVPTDMSGTSISCSCGTTIRLQDAAILALSLRYRSDKLLDLWLFHEQNG